MMLFMRHINADRVAPEKWFSSNHLPQTTSLATLAWRLL